MAGLISGWEQGTKRLARRFLYVRSKLRVGRQASITRMSVGVQVRQSIHYLWTLCQKAATLLAMRLVGEKTSPA